MIYSTSLSFVGKKIVVLKRLLTKCLLKDHFNWDFIEFLCVNLVIYLDINNYPSVFLFNKMILKQKQELN